MDISGWLKDKIDGWVVEWMDGWRDERDRWRDSWVGRGLDRLIFKEVDGWMFRWVDGGWGYRWMGLQRTDG